MLWFLWCFNSSMCSLFENNVVLSVSSFSSLTVLYSPNFPVDHGIGEKVMLEKTCKGHLVSSLVLRTKFEGVLSWSLRAFLILNFVLISGGGDFPSLRDPIPMLNYLPVIAPFPLSLIPSENFNYYKLLQLPLPITVQLWRNSLHSWSQKYHPWTLCSDCSSPILSLSFITCFWFLIILMPLC